jgi:hypothetical protein
MPEIETCFGIVSTFFETFAQAAIVIFYDARLEATTQSGSVSTAE